MHRLVVFGFVLMFVVGCDDDAPGGPFGTSRVERKVIPFGVFGDVDVLIVVDRSPAMEPFRAALVAQAAEIADVLENAPTPPSVHIGVVTSDLGAEGIAVPGCAGDGDGGRLRTDATIVGPYISDVAKADGTRARNYQGSLGEALGKLLDVGASGCPYSRPFSAARRAFDNTTDHAGFRRPDAYLGVIFVTAQDDCSFADASFLGGSTSTDTARCVAMASSLSSVDNFATYLRAGVTDPAKLVVGGVIAPTSPECAAQPATRVRALLQSFPNRHREASICGTSFAETFGILTQLLKSTLGIPCWESELFDGEPETPGLQPVCSASYRLGDGAEDLLPACGDDDRLCWRIPDAEAACPMTGRALHIDTRGRAYPTGGVATIECLVAE